MPITARCKECEYILYNGSFGVKRYFTAPSIPREIIKIHKGKCPKCGRTLEIPSIGDIVVLAVPEFDFPRRRERQEERKGGESR